MARVTAVIFDWAGTTVDHGSLAPVRTLQRLFARRGIEASEAQLRADMGIPKKEHIRALLRATLGRQPAEAMVADFYAEFIPMQMDCLAAYSAVIPGVVAAVDALRAREIKIGSTTGYTRAMLEVLLKHAASEGYIPDCALCPEDAGAGRPWPWMCYLNAIRLNVYPMYTMVKIGDTISDIEEGVNAGMWTIGVTGTGNLMGLADAQKQMAAAGAHYVIDSAADCLPMMDAIDERLSKGERP